MNCNELKDLLPFLDDGSLDESIERDAHDHLEHCDDCMREYEDIGRTLRIVDTALSMAPEPSMDDFILAVRQKINQQKRHNMLTYRILPVAAVLVATLTISFYSMLMNRTLSPDRNMFAISTADSEVSSYVAEYYLDLYEVYELTEENAEIDLSDTIDEMLENGYVDIAIPEIVDIMDEETATLLFE